MAKWLSPLPCESKVVGSSPDRAILFMSAVFFPETPRIAAGATEFVLCAILSAGGVPFLQRGTEPYGVKLGAMKSIFRL